MDLPINIDDIINFFYLFYRAIRRLIQYLFEATIVKADPSLAAKYADATTILITITALLLVLEIFSAAKKILRILVVIGWVLLILSILVGTLIH
ncbi:hypothetical protein DRO35_00070 [Candidatus Bathyarchaeota archaeon]|nr:MAG: hypothetical protein DRO35_00070 [Candidatus Bathyarchaeota archaeon]